MVSKKKWALPSLVTTKECEQASWNKMKLAIPNQSEFADKPSEVVLRIIFFKKLEDLKSD